jgi:hypothetical protein
VYENIPTNYRHQHYSHELTLDKLDVKNTELKIPVGPQLSTSQQLQVHATDTKNC